MFSQTKTASAAASASRSLTGGCVHCGEPCPGNAFALDGRNFCCLGCQTVFGLLHENGLGRFYTLESNPGRRVQAGSRQKWAFLDDAAVQEKLFDYADATQARVTLHLPAIHCIACVWLLENLFKLNPGIGRTQVNFSRREAAITFQRDRIKFSEVAALLASLGYEPQFLLGEMEGETARVGPSRQRQRAWLQLGLAAFGFGNIMLMSLPFYLGLDSFNSAWFKLVAGWLSLALALPVVTYSAGDFWRAAWAGWRQRTLTVEVPIVLGLAAIYGTSIHEVVTRHGPGFSDSLCGLIFFLLCGRLFQKRTHDRLTFDRDYKAFFPLSVVRKTAAGEETVAISRLQTGDRLILRHGELLPADARLVGGEACIDYSFVTGEAEPVKRAAGEQLYAGGRQTGGAIEIETIKPVAQSYLATLWNDEAFRKSSQQDLDSLTNRYSRRFTKLVIGVAAAAALYWAFADAGKMLKAFTSVLIVACPCALALAAPLTHGTAQRRLNRLNIFLKNPLVMERMAEVDTIVLDKTGTLTTADVRGVEFHGETRLTPEEAGWIAALTRHSTHPNSVRITKWLGLAELPVAEFREVPGSGIEGVVAGHRVRVGSGAWLGQGGVTIGAGGAAPGGVQVAIDGCWRGAFTLENTLRPEVAQLIGRLGGRFELVLLSGDNEREAARFQKLFGGRATLRFNQTPADKLNFIRERQQLGHRVMMVGDGLNDAGALQQADVGVAVVEQIGTFSPASDVILDAAQLPRLAEVLGFARSAARVVRAGFVISALYNVVGVGIAAAGLLAPIVCAILMPLSSATVVVFACGLTAWLGRRRLPGASGAGAINPAAGPLRPAATAWEAA